MIYFIRILEMDSMWYHIMWHGIYYAVYSFSQLAVCNLMVTSVGTKHTGTYLTISSAVARLGNISGPATLILVSALNTTGIVKFKSSFRMKNADIAYMFVLLLSVIRVVHTFSLHNPYKPRSRHTLDDAKAAMLPTTNENNTNVAMTPSIDGSDMTEDDFHMVNERYHVLPYVIFSINILSLIGAGLSIRFMFMYMVAKFQLPYRQMWFANMCGPIVSTVGLFGKPLACE